MQEMRKGKYLRNNSSDRDVMHTIAELQLPVETTAGVGGICLLPAATVEQLLLDKRRMELVQPFKLALLKLASQVGSLFEHLSPAHAPISHQPLSLLPAEQCSLTPITPTPLGLPTAALNHYVSLFPP
jgi:hypothetical protein